MVSDAGQAEILTSVTQLFYNTIWRAGLIENLTIFMSYQWKQVIVHRKGGPNYRDPTFEAWIEDFLKISFKAHTTF